MLLNVIPLIIPLIYYGFFSYYGIAIYESYYAINCDKIAYMYHVAKFIKYAYTIG